MKLKNKKTGEIVRVEFLNNWQTDDGTEIGFRECNTNIVYSYTSLAELNSEWEDYEEPKKHNFYNFTPALIDNRTVMLIVDEKATREEAKKVLEKLKAWKRLEDKGFRFNGGDDACISYRLDPAKWDDELEKDFDLLFGGEE